MFVVYRTTYLGNENLPKYYIGSTSLKNFETGYIGSVSSKKWKYIWEKEKSKNKNNFKCEIISKHNSREEAYEQEFKIQKELNVVENEDYINEIYANINFGDYILKNGSPIKNKKGYHNGNKVKYFGDDDVIGEEWLPGYSDSFKKIMSKVRKNLYHWYNPKTNESKRAKKCPGEDWIRGRKNFNNKGFEKANAKDVVNNVIDLTTSKKIKSLISKKIYHENWNYFYYPHKIDSDTYFFKYGDILFESFYTLKNYLNDENKYVPEKNKILKNLKVEFFGKAKNTIKLKNYDELKGIKHWQQYIQVIKLNEINQNVSENTILYTMDKNLILKKIKGN